MADLNCALLKIVGAAISVHLMRIYAVFMRSIPTLDIRTELSLAQKLIWPIIVLYLKCANTRSTHKVVKSRFNPHRLIYFDACTTQSSNNKSQMTTLRSELLLYFKEVMFVESTIDTTIDLWSSFIALARNYLKGIIP